MKLWFLRAWNSHYVRVEEYGEVKFATDPRDAARFKSEDDARAAADRLLKTHPNVGWFEVVCVALREEE